MVYAMKYRPMSTFTLPRGIVAEYVAAPWDIAHVRADLPRSRFRFGSFTTSRPLTEEEREHFGIDVVEGPAR